MMLKDLHRLTFSLYCYSIIICYLILPLLTLTTLLFPVPTFSMILVLSFWLDFDFIMAFDFTLFFQSQNQWDYWIRGRQGWSFLGCSFHNRYGRTWLTIEGGFHLCIIYCREDRLTNFTLVWKKSSKILIDFIRLWKSRKSNFGKYYINVDFGQNKGYQRHFKQKAYLGWNRL